MSLHYRVCTKCVSSLVCFYDDVTNVLFDCKPISTTCCGFYRSCVMFLYALWDVVVQVVDLLVAMCRAALESPRKSIIFEPYPSVVDPNDPKTLAFNPKVIIVTYTTYIWCLYFIVELGNTSSDLPIWRLHWFVCLVSLSINQSIHFLTLSILFVCILCVSLWTLGHRRKIMKDCRRH